MTQRSAAQIARFGLVVEDRQFGENESAEQAMHSFDAQYPSLQGNNSKQAFPVTIVSSRDDYFTAGEDVTIVHVAGVKGSAPSGFASTSMIEIFAFFDPEGRYLQGASVAVGS